MRMVRHGLAALAALLAWAPGTAMAQPCLQPACAEWFPADAGALNVHSFGAKGDGRTDDTAALLAAIAASGADTGRAVWHDRIVFLPAGRYLVSGTLLKRYANGKFASGLILIGESPERTVLQLADRAPGFGDPQAPRAVVMTSSKLVDVPAGRDYAGKGEGNDAYFNFVENLTIDVGKDNPGAIGVDYLANNDGAIRDVVIRAPAGSGLTGVAMRRKWPGPALLQRVSVQGFDVGIDIANTEYGMTLSQVHLSGQRAAGLRNANNMVSAEHLVIDGGAGTALVNETALGMVMLVGGSVGGGQGGALLNRGTIVFDGTRLPPGTPSVPASPSGQVQGWLDGQGWHGQVPRWSLPHPEEPVVAAGDHARWVGVSGAADDATPTDSTAALQAALAAGPTVYLRHGTFWISAPLELPPSLHRLIGMNSTIRVLPQARGPFPRDRGMLRIAQAGPPIQIERIAMDNTDGGDQSGIEVSAQRTVVLRDVFGAGVVTLDRREAGGPVFVANTCCGVWSTRGPAPIVGRQVNTEGSGVRIRNHDSPLVIIGIKTEGYCTVAESGRGARTQLLGGLLYMVRQPGPEPRPAFTTEDADLTAVFVEESLRPGSRYSLYLSAKGQGAREVDPASTQSRGLGRIVPLLWAGTPPVGN